MIIVIENIDYRSRHAVVRCADCGRYMRAWLSPRVCNACGSEALDLLTLVYNQCGEDGNWEIEKITRIGEKSMTNSSRTFMYIDKERFIPWLEKVKDGLIRRAETDVRDAEFCAGQIQLIESILGGNEIGLWDWQPAE